jgi:hypothetical protein
MHLLACQEAAARDQLQRPGLPPQILKGSSGSSMQWLENDKKVLRYFLCWETTNSSSSSRSVGGGREGTKEPYVLHYYLADDTVEVVEVQQRNSGKDPFPRLLHRGKLPRGTVSVGEQGRPW